MSKYQNHWSSKSDSTINKLDEGLTYNIVNVEKINTNFGKKYVLVDDEGNKYWTNNKVDEFIKEHKEVKQFELTTSDYKTFKNKKGEEIKFLMIDINY